MKSLKPLLITIALMVSVGISAWGSPIDWTKAEAVATRFAQTSMSQSSNAQWQRVARKGMATPGANAPLYVFNRADGHGFVIVAGDDAAVPILGYSDEGAFSYDNMPENLRQWLALNELYVKACAGRQGVARQASQGTPVVAPVCAA